MLNLLSFVNPAEYLLRYTVIIAMVIIAVGIALCALAKVITLHKRHTTELDPQDRLYVALTIIGIALIVIGIIVAALPVDKTFYNVK